MDVRFLNELVRYTYDHQGRRGAREYLMRNRLRSEVEHVVVPLDPIDIRDVESLLLL